MKQKLKQKKVKGKHPGGRPTDYKEEYIQKVEEYLEENQDKDVQELSGLSAKGTELYRNKTVVSLPTIEGFALFIGIPRRTVFDWKDKYPEFSHSLEKILAEQQKRLLNKGLSGDYNPTIAKLILSSNHGMREKTETDITTGGKPIENVSINGMKPEQIDEYLKSKLNKSSDKSAGK